MIEMCVRGNNSSLNGAVAPHFFDDARNALKPTSSLPVPTYAKSTEHQQSRKPDKRDHTVGLDTLIEGVRLPRRYLGFAVHHLGYLDNQAIGQLIRQRHEAVYKGSG